MNGVVVDASVVVAWLMDDENELRADRALEQLQVDGAMVPHHFHVETRNSLLVAERGGRLSEGDVHVRLAALSDLPIRTDNTPDFQAAYSLAKVHQLTFYDAMYLELAKRRGAELATLDRALGRAAIAERVELLTP